jgi:nitrite reductase/ring-hydroxylating ferredoxin subunit
MARFVKVAQVSEIPSGQRKAVSVDGVGIVVFNIDGTFYAVNEKCPHRGRSLARGRLRGAVLVCPWHSAQFDLETGTPVSQRPPTDRLTVHQVKVEGEDILVAVNRGD